jgi:hypothetical protein
VTISAGFGLGAGNDGGAVNVQSGGAFNNTGDGGNIVMTGGTGGNTTGTGGGFVLTGGTGDSGGAFSFTGGAGKNTNNSGGGFTATGGNANAAGTGAGGPMVIRGGNGGPTGQGGSVTLRPGTGGAAAGNVVLQDSTGTTKVTVATNVTLSAALLLATPLPEASLPNGSLFIADGTGGAGTANGLYFKGASGTITLLAPP